MATVDVKRLKWNTGPRVKLRRKNLWVVGITLIYTRIQQYLVRGYDLVLFTSQQHSSPVDPDHDRLASVAVQKWITESLYFSYSYTKALSNWARNLWPVTDKTDNRDCELVDCRASNCDISVDRYQWIGTKLSIHIAANLCQSEDGWRDDGRLSTERLNRGRRSLGVRSPSKVEEEFDSVRGPHAALATLERVDWSVERHVHGVKYATAEELDFAVRTLIAAGS